MSLDSDVIVDRRRIRRKLTFWRVLTVLLAAAGVVCAGLVLSPGARNALATSGSIARVNIEGLILSGVSPGIEVGDLHGVPHYGATRGHPWSGPRRRG